MNTESSEFVEQAKEVARVNEQRIAELNEEKVKLEIGLTEQTTKVNAIEQQNLKYKAKLKQLLKQQQQPKPQENSAHGLLSLPNEELRSNCSTPVNHSPAYRGYEFVSVSIQTENDDSNTQVHKIDTLLLEKVIIFYQIGFLEIKYV